MTATVPADWQNRRRLLLAIHEAGHVVAAFVHAIPVEEAWVGVPGRRGWTLAYCQTESDATRRDRAPVLIEMHAAGFAAESLAGTRSFPWARFWRSGDGHDARWTAWSHLTGDDRLFPDPAETHTPAVERLVRARVTNATLLVRQRWTAVQAVAAALLASNGLVLDTTALAAAFWKGTP